MRTGEVKMNATDRIGIAAETKVNLNSTGEVKISSGDFKVVEAPDVAFNILGSGTMTIVQFAEGLFKLINSIGG
jgi:hypothetical protein